MKGLDLGQILEGTFFLILVYLVLSQAGAFSQVTSAVAAAYGSSVRALQGRGG